MARILVVDDYQLQREMFSKIFSLEGYNVDEAGTLDEGLSKLAENYYDTIVTDWHLGFRGSTRIYSEEIARRADKAGSLTVILTGTDDSTGRLASLLEELPNVRKIDKPAAVEKILRSVER
jgi:DNA-binding response OmpR family regulator